MTKQMEQELELVEEVTNTLGKQVTDIKISRPRRLFICIEKEGLEKAVQGLFTLGFSQLSTITGVDTGQGIEVIYHLNRDGKILLSVKVCVDKEHSSIPTITTFIPGATLYEREIHDLFGVTFTGHQDLSPLILPEDWPKDVFPLRKEWSIEAIQKNIEGEE